MPLSPAKFRLADRDVRRIAQAITDLKSAESHSSSNGNGTDLRKLLNSVNSASQAARNAWLGYLAILAYLLVTLAGVTHKDLLLNSPTNLPFVNVGIPLTGFFRFAPMVLLFFMFGLLQQHHMLHEKLTNLRHELPPEPETDDTPDVRDEIHSYFFAQAVVGRRRDRKHVLIAYRWMLFVTFIAAPLVLLLYFQTSFLPYHSESMAWWHRVLLIGGVAVLWWVGHDLRLMDQDLRGVSDIGVWGWIGEKVEPALSLVGRIADRLGKRLNGPLDGIRVQFTIALKWLSTWVCKIGTFASVLVFLSLIATSVPDSTMDDVTEYLFPKWLIPIDDWIKIFGGKRNLVVTEQDLVKDKEIVKGEFVHSLRGRDLRYADFSRSDLKQTDFEDAKVQYAQLVSTDLKGANFRGANLEGANLSEASLQGADLREASLQGADLRKASIQGANLRSASLQGADLGSASLQGAILRSANLLGTDLGSANLQGANLRVATVHGADLGSANLHGANLGYVKLQGAHLGWTNLQGANLHMARLQGADLRRANLKGADLRKANFRGADLRRAGVWRTRRDEKIMGPFFDARAIEIDWPNAIANAREAVSSLTQLADDMRREKTPGHQHVAAARDHVTKKLRPLLELPSRRQLIDAKESMCTLHASRDRLPADDKSVTGPATRITIISKIACDDTTDKANIARNIAQRVASGRAATPASASIFLTALDKELCHHIRDKLPKPLLRQMRKYAAGNSLSSWSMVEPEPDETPVRSKDAADYYCTTPSKPGQLPIPEGPPY